MHHPFLRPTAALLASSLVLSAQTTVTYTNNQNDSTARTTTSANSLVLGVAGGTATQSGAIDGDGSLTKTGAGTLILTGSQTYTGGTTITTGTLQFGNGTSTANLLNGDVINHGTLILRTLIDRSVLPIDYAGTISGSGSLKVQEGAYRLTAANTFTGTTSIPDGLLVLGHELALQYSTLIAPDVGEFYFGDLQRATLGGLAGYGPISLSSPWWDPETPFVLTVGNNNENTVFRGGFYGNGSILKVGTGTLSLTGSSSYYSGAITVKAGLIGFNSLANFGSGRVSLDGGGLQWSAGNTIDISSATQFNRTLGADGGTFDTNGNNVVFASPLEGIGGLTKTGTGTLTLSGANTYNGATSVNAGTLLVNGTLASTAVSVHAGGNLGGSGTLAGLTTFFSGATLAPGNSPGTLTFGGGLVLESGAILDFELGATSDLVVVSGGVFSGPATGLVTLNITDAGGFTAGTYTLFDFTNATSVTSVDLSDFTLGTTLAGYDYAFTFVGNTLALTATAQGSAIPEPSTYATLFGAAVLGLAAYRRRRVG